MGSFFLYSRSYHGRNFAPRKSTPSVSIVKASGVSLGVQSLDSVGEKSGQVFVFCRLVVEFSDNVFVELVGNGAMREHCPVDGNELYDESRR
jgi:hypothetical protein